MAHLYLYATRADGSALAEWLNSEPDVNWIVSAGPGRWHSVDATDRLPEGLSLLWHVPSGPLPLFATLADLDPVPINNPWLGWDELVASRNRERPWFGGAYPGVVELHFYPEGQPGEPERGSNGYLGVSAFGWTGMTSQLPAFPPCESTRRWWVRLRSWVARTGIKVIGAVPVNSPPLPIYALPGAFRLIQEGRVQRYVSSYRAP